MLDLLYQVVALVRMLTTVKGLMVMILMTMQMRMDRRIISMQGVFVSFGYYLFVCYH